MPICKHCQHPFSPKRAWQKFCTPAHKDAFHAEEKRTAAKLAARIRELERELAAVKGGGN